MLAQEYSVFSELTYRDQDQINTLQLEVIKYPTKKLRIIATQFSHFFKRKNLKFNLDYDENERMI
jgi:hypothetical protein